ncbi:malate dehydrogenase [Salinibaculum salinum]|uniref:malate dehydrogenase n=1 Tax=Salinibaculum salinum TaxID=3131996 RepID=UPI0030EB7A2C
MTVTILGTGTIGSTVAYTLATEMPSMSVRLTDVDEEKSRGHTIDVRHSKAHVAHSVGNRGETDQSSNSVVEHVSPGPGAVDGADCIVMTASAPRPTGANQPDGREAWLEDNLEIVETVGEWLQPNDPCPVIVVSNPLDPITYELYRQSGWPSSYFMGYSLSETARLADALAREYEVSHDDVYCPVLGMHGEHMVPIFSRATIAGEPIDIGKTKRQQLLDYVRDVPYDVIELRGAADSSRWVTSRGIALLVQTLRDGGVTEPVGLSTPLDSAYGFEGVSLSVPVTLDSTGIVEIIEWDLSEQERAQMDKAHQAVASMIPE